MAFWCLYSPVIGQTYLEQARALDKEMKDYLLNEAPMFLRPDTSIITGHFGDAMAISFIPDARVIGVYMFVDQGYEFSIDELVLPTKSYFDYYGLPAIIVKQEKPLEGKGARIRIYINGKCFEGDVATGDLSLYDLQQNHAVWFEKIKAQYKLVIENQG